MNINKNFLPAKTQKTMETNINEVSRISHGTTIRGDLSSSTDIRVDGQVDGTLYSEGKVVVGESAQLSGKLFCTNVDFWGKMDGDFYVKDQLSLKSSAVVNGNIHVRKIQVEMGAQINGSFKMITEQEYDQMVAAMVRKPAAAAPAPAKASPKPVASASKPVAPAPAPKAAAPAPKPAATPSFAGSTGESPTQPAS